jgi:hypothetical protein
VYKFSTSPLRAVADNKDVFQVRMAVGEASVPRQDGSFRVRFPGNPLGEFKVTYFLLPAFSSPAVHSDCNRNEYHGIILGVKCGRRAELKTVPSWVFPNGKVRTEMERFVPPLSLYDLLQEKVYFYVTAVGGKIFVFEKLLHGNEGNCLVQNFGTYLPN